MEEGASNLKIRAILYDESDLIIRKEELLLPIQHLHPGESFPITLSFPKSPEVDQIEIDVLSYQISLNRDVELEVEITDRNTLGDGSYVLAGWLSNPRNIGVQIHNFSLVFTENNGSIHSIITPEIYNSSLLPSQRVPFLATLDQNPNTLSVRPFLDVTELQNLEQAPFSFPQEAELVLDSQGNLLLRGIIKNDHVRPLWVSCIVALHHQDRLISLSQLKPPFPLAAGEVRSFGLTQFPGWKEQLTHSKIELEEVEISFFCDALASSEFKGQIFTLNASITGFETTGSSLIIRGEVSNLTSETLSYVSVQADLRTIDGDIHTSNTIPLEEVLDPGGTTFFVLPVRLPAGTVLPDMEIDVRAIAILEESELPF
jgi:hypothetical protein